jgi:NAD(P)-dependent dehydrogenase (short-subunit alcohol dehydrogenase family)
MLRQSQRGVCEVTYGVRPQRLVASTAPINLTERIAMDTQDPRHAPDKARRMMVEGMAGGLLAAVVAAPAAAQGTAAQGAAAAASAPAGTPPNPVDAYPKPPFPAQQQPWPGLASKMSPRPDHGETSYRGSGRLRGRKALITGGDSGIGRAAAIAFAREGADVAINYLPAEEADAREVVQLIRAEGRKAAAIPGDLKEEAFCKRLVADAARELGGLDILVNNAARQVSRDSILDITTAQFDETFKTNVYAMFWLSKAAVAIFKPGAAIINTASVNAYDPGENIIDYAATKGAIMIFTKGLAKQLAPKGIRVNAVAPGPFWTPLQVTGGQPPDKLPKFGEDTPMGRPGQPAELAAIYVLLASGEASYTTGQVFAAVGGRGGP